MAHWVNLLVIDSPEHAVYGVANSVNMAAKDKESGVNPLDPGTIWIHLWGRFHLGTRVRPLTRSADGSQLTDAGLRIVIKVCIPEVHAVWPESAGWSSNRGVDAPSRSPQPSLLGIAPLLMLPITQEGMDGAGDFEPEEEDKEVNDPLLIHASQSIQEVAAQASAFDHYTNNTEFGSLLLNVCSAFMFN